MVVGRNEQDEEKDNGALYGFFRHPLPLPLPPNASSRVREKSQRKILGCNREICAVGQYSRLGSVRRRASRLPDGLCKLRDELLN